MPKLVPEAEVPLVLVVDDHEAKRYLMASRLAHAGYRVAEAASGEEALRRCAGGGAEGNVLRPDLVLLDTHMPQLDGFAVLERLKADPRTAGIPVLQVSASFTAPSDRARALESGAAGYLTSPAASELTAAVGALLRARRAEEERERVCEELHAALAEVRTSEERLRLVVEGVKDYAIFMLDVQGRITTWNAGAERLTGWAAQEVLGLPFSHFFPRDELETGQLDEELRVATVEGRWAGGGWRLRKDGVPFWAEVTLRALREPGPGGRLRGYVKVMHDATERLHLEQERRLADAALRRRAEFEQQLIGIVSHDLRNPLHATLAAVSLLQHRGGLDPSQARLVERIAASTERAHRMVRDLLDFTRARAGGGGGLPLHCARADLHDVVAHVVDEVRLAHPGREVRLEEEGEPPEGDWDADRLGQAVTNLLTNALQYGAPGTPVCVRLRSRADALRVEVHNQGEPVPEELLPRLFEPLQRGHERDDGTSRARRSIGLGLYIVNQVALAHGGRVEVSSSRTEGTTFSLCLPRCQPPAPAPAPA